MIDIFTTGGTIDKIYFDAKSDYEVGDPQITELLHDSCLTVEYRVTSLMRKDSLDMTDDDRRKIRDAIEVSDASGIVVTDLLPDGLDYRTDVASSGSFSAVAGKWEIPMLAHGEGAGVRVV